MSSKKETKKELKYTKEQIVESNLFKEYRDLLDGNLEIDASYTLQEIECIIKKGKVD